MISLAPLRLAYLLPCLLAMPRMTAHTQQNFDQYKTIQMAPVDVGSTDNEQTNQRPVRSGRTIYFMQAPRETSVASSPIIIAQQQQQQLQQAVSPQTRENFKAPTNHQSIVGGNGGHLVQTQSAINSLYGGQFDSQVNIPVTPPTGTLTTQRDLAHIFKEFTLNNDNTEQLNLASMNYRRLDHTPQQPRPDSTVARFNPQLYTQESLMENQQKSGPPRMRSEQLTVKSQNNNNNLMVRKGKQESVDVKRVDHYGVASKLHDFGIKKMVTHDKLALPPGCIFAAGTKMPECEDHLIKRLNKDATEGRTVIDVSRRVCCALFWHKDCVSRVVVQACPDSSPQAVDTLLGSRNLDLTLSCQRFNRDGCNGASPISISPICFVLMTLGCIFLIRMTLVNR